MLVLSNAVDIIVIDSVAALVPRAEIEGEIGDTFVGVQARLMSQALRKLTGGVSRSKCVLIFINQIREKIGVMFGSPETTPGGRALKFYSSCRIDVRRIGPVKDGEEVVGSRIKAKVVKNKVAPPFRVCEFDMMYTHGISREADLLDLAIVDKLIDKSGSWFNYGDLRLGQGRENTKQYLRDNPDVADEIAAKVIANRTASGREFTPMAWRMRLSTSNYLPDSNLRLQHLRVDVEPVLPVGDEGDATAVGVQVGNVSRSGWHERLNGPDPPDAAT